LHQHQLNSSVNEPLVIFNLRSNQHCVARMTVIVW